MQYKSIFDVDMAELKQRFSDTLQQHPPSGLFAPQLLEVLCFCGPDVDETFQDWYDPSDDVHIWQGKAMEPVKSYGHDLNCIIMMILRDGEKSYLADENLALLTAGFDEIRSFAAQGYKSELFEVRNGQHLGVVDHRGRFIAEAKYVEIIPRSVTRYQSDSLDIRHTDLISCRLPQANSVNDWEVLSADGTVIFSGLCYPPDVCEEKRRYQHFSSFHQVGGKYYEEWIESFYVLRSYTFELGDDEEVIDNALEYSFRVPLFDLLLGNAEAKPDEQIDITRQEYPRQQGRLTLRRGLFLLRA